MKLIVSIISTLLIFSSCGDYKKEHEAKCENEVMSSEDSLTATMDSLHIESHIDMSLVDEKDKKDFIKSLAAIEHQYGEQWDFCTCIVKNDSIDKAFKKQLSDSEYDRLADRFDVIDVKCKAFLAQNPNQTPEDRAKHEKKVKNCLKAAGIKN